MSVPIFGDMKLDTYSNDKQNNPSKKGQVEFTDRQIAVLKSWADCATIAEVAVTLGLSENTVQTQLKRMRKKLGVNRTFDVYKHVLKRGLLG